MYVQKVIIIIKIYRIAPNATNPVLNALDLPIQIVQNALMRNYLAILPVYVQAFIIQKIKFHKMIAAALFSLMELLKI